MRAEAPLGRQPVDLLWPGPSLRRAQHDHRPPRPLDRVRSRIRAAVPGLDRGDLVEHLVERRRHQLVHLGGIGPLDEPRGVAVALEQAAQLVLGYPGEHRRVGDLVAVQMQDREDRAVLYRVEELVRVPARCERPGLGLAVSDDAHGDAGPGCRTPRRTRATSEYPSSPPSLIDPGVSGATWLGIPPGNENWRNSRRMPSAS